ncbi:DUF3900 domain-containing protein [Aneurinibacillus sp. Ricciae_BoGa-3]|uniref:DUF3900 domain-containing protein n=1 Tax=Aneurinibacillus sp. Ricciae_BoGa-3 TaxID=3022697 RepID=UPI002340350F|nr:DUF3900 domain-containing protein [Aneurinibacillus sp. Ricciae_BoGa-3]WCK52690.1 DUF3900 domain-containing protein [Aneurinibacillus sp. Ricciae_BoGa-3]
MDFTVEYVSFYVISGDQQDKSFKHYQTLDETDYESSELKEFLDGEWARIAKRKVERHPKSEQVPTKIGRFIVEPGFGLESNPNYSLFSKILRSGTKQDFESNSNALVQAYTDTAAIRGGALIVARAKLNKYFDDPFLFILKCDFEQKIASISDERSLIRSVEMAISAKNMKSVQYPHMPEEGMLEEWELKIHQATHARYFEDFLKYVTYEKSVPEIMNQQVIGMVQEHIEQTMPENTEQREREEKEIEIWAASEQRDLQEKWTPEQVMEANRYLVEQKPDIEMKLKLDHISVKALLADFGENIHIAKIGERYVLIIEGDQFQFEKGMSPIELLRPEQLQVVLEKIEERQRALALDDAPPF